MILPPLAEQEDRAIRHLLAHYVHLLDGGEAEAWAALFTPEGQWLRHNAAPSHLGGSGIVAGVKAGRRELAELAAFSVRNFRGLCRHQMTDLLLWRGNGGEALGKCRMLITDFRDGPGKVAMAGCYDFSFAELPGEGWRIARLEASFLPT